MKQTRRAKKEETTESHEFNSIERKILSQVATQNEIQLRVLINLRGGYYVYERETLTRFFLNCANL